MLIEDFYKCINYFDPEELEEMANIISNIDRMNTKKYGIQIIGVTRYNIRNIELGRLKVVFTPIDYTEFIKILNENFVNISKADILEENKKLAKQYERIDKGDTEPIEEKDNIEPVEEEDDTDPLLSEAIEAVVEIGQASTSFIQRRFEVGYARAGRIIDQMEERGVISEYQGSKPREVLMTLDKWNELKMAPGTNDTYNISDKTNDISTELRLVNNFINNNLKNENLRNKFESERNKYYEAEKAYNKKIFKSSTDKVNLLKQKAKLLLYEETMENLEMNISIKEMLDIFINDTTLKKFDYIELEKLFGEMYEDVLDEFLNRINTYNPHDFETKIKAYLKVYEICRNYYSKREDLYDEYLFDGISDAIEVGAVSVSLLQRKLEVGYAQANRIKNQLEELGIISKNEDSKPSKVLITAKEEELLNEILEQIEEICKK